MSDSKQREADLIQARERLATALTRLSTLVGGVPEQFQLLDRSRTDAIQKLREIEKLLENERAIAAQRDSLSDTTRGQLHSTSEELSAAREIITERDTHISNLESEIRSYQENVATKDTSLFGLNAELEAKQAILASLDEQNRELRSTIEQLQSMLDEQKQAHEEMRQEFEHHRQLTQEAATQFSNDERQQLLQTVDSLIERIDRIAPSNGQH